MGALDQIPIEQYEMLLDITDRCKVFPSSSQEMEEYFKTIIDEYGDLEKKEMKEKIRDRVKNEFIALRKRPSWVQNPEWPIHNGKPMIFIGQLTKGYNTLGISFDMVFYVFYDPKDGCVKTIIQTD